MWVSMENRRDPHRGMPQEVRIYGKHNGNDALGGALPFRLHCFKHLLPPACTSVRQLFGICLAASFEPYAVIRAVDPRGATVADPCVEQQRAEATVASSTSRDLPAARGLPRERTPPGATEVIAAAHRHRLRTQIPTQALSHSMALPRDDTCGEGLHCGMTMNAVIEPATGIGVSHVRVMNAFHSEKAVRTAMGALAAQRNHSSMSPLCGSSGRYGPTSRWKGVLTMAVGVGTMFRPRLRRTNSRPLMVDQDPSRCSNDAGSCPVDSSRQAP